VVLGLDVGRARIGVARAEHGTGLAFGRGAIERRGTGPDVEAVRALVQAEGAALIVVGLPSPTRGEESRQTRLVRSFAAALRAAGLEVVFEDERFTTALSERRLRDAALPRARRHAKGAVDEASAILILESYLARAEAASADGPTDAPSTGAGVGARTAAGDGGPVPDEVPDHTPDHTPDVRPDVRPDDKQER
jgi:putative Holliday junction resolvase